MNTKCSYQAARTTAELAAMLQRLVELRRITRQSRDNPLRNRPRTVKGAVSPGRDTQHTKERM